MAEKAAKLSLEEAVANNVAYHFLYARHPATVNLGDERWRDDYRPGRLERMLGQRSIDAIELGEYLELADGIPPVTIYRSTILPIGFMREYGADGYQYTLATTESDIDNFQHPALDNINPPIYTEDRAFIKRIYTTAGTREIDSHDG